MRYPKIRELFCPSSTEKLRRKGTVFRDLHSLCRRWKREERPNGTGHSSEGISSEDRMEDWISQTTKDSLIRLGVLISVILHPGKTCSAKEGSL